jgi:MFS family permease
LQRIVPDRIRGRIFSFDFALITLSLTISALLTGWAAERFGPRPTVAVLGGIAVLWAATWTWLTTDVRRRTRLEGCVPSSELELAAPPEPEARSA